MRQFLLIVTTFVFSLFVLSSFVLAQDSTSQTVVDPPEAFPPKRERMIEKKSEVKDAMKEKRQEVRENIQAKRVEVRDEIKKKREELQLTIKEKREEFKKNLQELKDEKKKQIVDRLDAKMSMINTNTTDRMLSHLEKMEDILSRLQEKVDTAKNEGKDTTAAQNAITNAQNLIDAAKDAVTEQAGKDYTPTISDETTLRRVVGTSMSGLRADLSALHKQVVDAKQAVMKAVMEVAKLRGKALEPTTGEPTIEPTTEPTVAPTITP